VKLAACDALLYDHSAPRTTHNGFQMIIE